MPTPELGTHGAIEFANRMLTFVLVAVAIIMFLFVVRMRARAPRPVLAVARDRPVRAAAGDHRRHHRADEPEPVRRRDCILRLGRARRSRGGARRPRLRRAGPARARRAALVRGAHAHDERRGARHGAGRHPRHRAGTRTPAMAVLRATGSTPSLMQHVHAWPAYAPSPSPSCCSSARGARPGAQRLAGPGCCSLSSSSQIAVGLWQARTGLPVVLVNIHMVLAVLLVAAMTAVVMHLKAAVQVDGGRSAYAGSVEAAPARR